MNGYVNKQTIIRKLKKFAIDCLKEDQLERYTAYSTAACAIAMTKSAEVQPVKLGKWKQDEEGYDTYIECSRCGISLNICDYEASEWREVMNFCPNCGADMREKEGAERNE